MVVAIALVSFGIMCVLIEWVKWREDMDAIEERRKEIDRDRSRVE